MGMSPFLGILNLSQGEGMGDEEAAFQIDLWRVFFPHNITVEPQENMTMGHVTKMAYDVCISTFTV